MPHVWKLAMLSTCLMMGRVVAADVPGDTIDEAEAKRRGITVEQVQIEYLKKDNAELRTKVVALQTDDATLKAKIATIIAQIDALKVAANQPAGVTSSQAAASPMKQVVLSSRDFSLLPKGSQTKAPLGFTTQTMNALGYIHSVRVVNVIDESTAIVEYAFDNADGTMLLQYGQPFSKQMVIEGVPTSGTADNSGWKLDGWFKIVATGKFEGTTYFVAWPLVEVKTK